MPSNDLQKKVAIYQELERRGEIKNLPPEKQAVWAELKRRGVAGQAPAPQGVTMAPTAPVTPAAAPAPQPSAGGIAGFGQQVYDTIKDVAAAGYKYGGMEAVVDAREWLRGAGEFMGEAAGDIAENPGDAGTLALSGFQRTSGSAVNMLGRRARLSLTDRRDELEAALPAELDRMMPGLTLDAVLQRFSAPDGRFDHQAAQQQMPAHIADAVKELIDTREAIAQGLHEEPNVLELAGQSAKDMADRRDLGVDPEFQKSPGGVGSQAIGGSAPMMAGPLGPLMGAGAMADEQHGDYLQSMKEQGLEPTQEGERDAMAYGAALMPLEWLPVSRIAARAKRLLGGANKQAAEKLEQELAKFGDRVRQYGLDVAQGMAEEGFTEFSQVVGKNVIAKDLMSYDEAREYLGDDVDEQTYAGMTVGGFMAAVMGLPGLARGGQSGQPVDPDAVPSMGEQMDALNDTETPPAPESAQSEEAPAPAPGGIQLSDGSTMRSVQDVMADRGVQPLSRPQQPEAAPRTTVARIIEENRRAKAERQQREQDMAPYVGLQQQLTAENEVAQKRKDVVDTDRDDLLSAIAKLGGLDPDSLGGEVDLQTMRQMQRVGRPIVRGQGQGKTLDHMAEILAEDGFTAPDGSPLDPNSLTELIDNASRGERIFSRNSARDSLLDPDNEIAGRWFGGSRDRLMNALQKHIDGKPLSPNQQGAIDDLTNILRGGDESIYRERDLEQGQQMDITQGQIPKWFGELVDLDPAGAESTMQAAALSSLVEQDLDAAEQAEHIEAMVDWGLNDFTDDAGQRAQGIEPGIANLAIQAAAAGATIDEINAAMDMAGDNPSAAIGALMGMAAREEVIDDREIAALDWEYERSEGAQPAGPERDSDAVAAADYEQDARLERAPAGGFELAGGERGSPEVGGGINAAPEGRGQADAESQQAADRAEGVAPREVTRERRSGDRRASSADALQKYLDGEELTREEAILLATHSEVAPLPNKRAFKRVWREHERRARANPDYQMPLVVSIDADSLKWVNDNLSHDDGDFMLKAIGEALAESGADAFHLSGDEFALLTPSREAGDAAVAAAQEILSQVDVLTTGIDGKQYRIKGLTLTHGIGDNIKSADADMQSVKARKEAAGERASRGEQPAWITQADESGNEGSDGESRQADGRPEEGGSRSEGEGSPEGLTLQSTETPADAGVSRSEPQEDDLFGLTDEQRAQQALKDEQAKRDKKRDEQAARAELQSDGPLFDGTAQQQQLEDAKGQRLKVVNPAAIRFDVEAGQEFMVWPPEGKSHVRAIRPITKSNPNPSKFSPNYPPTILPANDVERAFGLPLSERGEQDIDAEAHEAATSPRNDRPEPTEAQIEAGNYKKGHITVGGLDITIENPRGSMRRGTDPDGNAWEQELAHHYGYLKRTEGADGEHVDVFVGKTLDSDKVFIVDQVNPDGSFDEHKVMLGFKSKAGARSGYKANYEKGWKVGQITEMSLDEFKLWLRNGDLTRPVSEVASTAPEHSSRHDDLIGLSPEQMKAMVDEFAQAEAVTDAEGVTSVFKHPEKSEIVRLNDKVKVYHKEHGWMTPAEAKARIEEWKQNADKQYDEHRSENNQRVVLSFFDLSGAWSQPWEDAGYQVYRFDIQADPDMGDVNNFSVEFFADWFGDFDGNEVYAILAACPCTDFAVSGARHFAAKDADGRTIQSVRLVHQTLAAIEYFKPPVWALENPVGRIEKLGGLPPWRLSFDPNHLGETYTKKTLIWGRFNADLPIAPVDPVEGSKMHSQYGGKSIATKNARSKTPEGFAYAFFQANNAIDHPVMAISNKYDQLDPKAIKAAVDAGISEVDIKDIVDDFYYMDMAYEKANEALYRAAREGLDGDADVAPVDDAPAPQAEVGAPQERFSRDFINAKKAIISRGPYSGAWDVFVEWFLGPVEQDLLDGDRDYIYRFEAAEEGAELLRGNLQTFARRNNGDLMTFDREIPTDIAEALGLAPIDADEAMRSNGTSSAEKRKRRKVREMRGQPVHTRSNGRNWTSRESAQRKLNDWYLQNTHYVRALGSGKFDIARLPEAALPAGGLHDNVGFMYDETEAGGGYIWSTLPTDVIAPWVGGKPVTLKPEMMGADRGGMPPPDIGARVIRVSDPEAAMERLGALRYRGEERLDYLLDEYPEELPADPAASRRPEPATGIPVLDYDRPANAVVGDLYGENNVYQALDVLGSSKGVDAKQFRFEPDEKGTRIYFNDRLVGRLAGSKSRSNVVTGIRKNAAEQMQEAEGYAERAFETVLKIGPQTSSTRNIVEHTGANTFSVFLSGNEGISGEVRFIMGKDQVEVFYNLVDEVTGLKLKQLTMTAPHMEGAMEMAVGHVLATQQDILYQAGKAEAAPAPEPAAPQADTKAKDFGANNKLVTKDAAEDALARIRAKLHRANTGVDPELMADTTKVAVYYIEAGVRAFPDFVKAMVEALGTDIIPYLRSAYEGARYYPGMDDEGMTPSGELNAIMAKADQNVDNEAKYRAIIEEADNESRPDGDLERDRGDATPADEVGQSVVPAPGERSGRESGSRGDEAAPRQRGEQGDRRAADSAAPAGGESGNLGLDFGDEPAGAASGTAGSSGSRGSRTARRDGAPPQSEPGRATAKPAAEGAVDLKSKRQAQNAANRIPVRLNDPSNVAETLPYLLADQIDDVVKIERRLFGQDKAGVLVTNGTGTGKTYTGGGTIARAFRAGLTEQLIVVPSQAKADDWVEDMANLGMTVNKLDGIRDQGKPGINITTYANFSQNMELLKRDFQLVTYDESHRLNQNQDNGGDTAAQKMHFATANKKGATYLKAYARDPRYMTAYYNRIENEKAELAKQTAEYVDENGTQPTGRQRDILVNSAKAKAEDMFRTEISPFIDELIETAKALDEQLAGTGKVQFLSATPFGYHFNLDYADGFLFDFPRSDDDSYNSASGRDGFYMAAFGYRKRYNKLTIPETGVDVGLMERQFHEQLKKEGALIGRQLDVPFDYSRDFIHVNTELGKQIDKGIKLATGMYRYDDELLMEVLARAYEANDLDINEMPTDPEEARHDAALPKFDKLSNGARQHFNYAYIAQLREAVLAQELAPRIREHLKMGRKVVLFHDYRQPPGRHPFDFGGVNHGVKGDDAQVIAAYRELEDDIDTFHQLFPEMKALDLSALKSVDELVSEEFGKGARTFNGTVSDKDKIEAKRAFNDDKSGVDVIAVQRQSGKEGLSLHDIKGDVPRALIDLGLPIRPTDAIQTEGRIYRMGQQSDAVIEYPVLALQFEQRAFAEKVSKRARTPENLAMGDKARDMEMAFKEGYLNAGPVEVSAEQGKGGKEMDRTIVALTDFDKAKSYYFANQKNTKRRDQREGQDYFATPEPLGFKMTEWLDAQPNDRLLEPSAGHGAIARFFPGNARNTFVEPSPELSAKLGLYASGEIKPTTFENHNIVNKYEGIAMNPPFGHGGSMAVEHLKKATVHLANGGRVVAIIPTGPAADKKLDAFLESKDAKHLYQVARIKLPRVTFERAGTAVSTQIVVLEKHPKPETAPEQMSTVDLTHIEDINEFFDRIKHMELPPRRGAEAAPEVEGAAPAENAAAAAPAGDTVKTSFGEMVLYTFQHSKTGEDILLVIPQKRLDSAFKTLVEIAKGFGGWYNRYAGGQAKRGFAFKTEQQRREFLGAINAREVSEDGPRYSLAPSRTGWDPKTQKVVVVNKPGEFQRHADYDAAKYDGDLDAAFRLTRDMLPVAAVEELKRRVVAAGASGRAPIIVPVHAKEGLSTNRIPAMAAVNLSEQTGWSVADDVVQLQEAGRSGGDGFYRLVNQPAFDGDIQPGREYVLVDDTLTQGGTLASLKGFIESRGGRVVGTLAMEGKQYSSRLAPTDDTLRALKERWPELEGWWNENFSYGIDRLTESEARYLARIRGVSSFEQLRDRILAARSEGVDPTGPGTGPQRTPQSVAPEARPTAGLSVSELRKSIRASLGESLAASVEVVQSTADLPLATGMSSQIGSDRVEGLYHDGKVYLVADNLPSADRAAWVAWHELWHRGARGLGGGRLKEALQRADANDAVRKLADAIMADRGMTAGDRLIALEEALAELNAADETGNYDGIEQRYGVRVPQGLRSGVRGHIARFMDLIRGILRRLGIGKQAVLDRDVFEIITGARRSYERGVTDLQREAGTPGKVSEDGPAQGDLFAQAEPESRSAILKAFTKAYLAETGTLTTHVQPLTNSQHVAQMLRPWSDFAQELFIVVPTDENHMPLGIIRHTKGGFAEASVFPDVVSGDILMTKAKHYWIAHNHPSGLPSPSQADKVITNRISTHLHDLGITMHGHVILGSETFFQLDDAGAEIAEFPYPDLIAEEGKPVKVYERMLKRLLPESERRMPIDGPTAAKATLIRLGIEDANGILALDNKHSVLDVITFDGDPASLRDPETRRASPAAVDFVRRLAEAGAVRGIVFAQSPAAAKNLSHLSSSVVGILDAMAPEYSAVDKSDSFTPGKFLSVAPARDITDTVAFKRWFGDSKVVDRNGAPLVVYHGTPDGRFIDEDGTFKSQKEKWGMGNPMGAHWFASSRSIADSYADDRRALDYQNSEPRTVAAYLRLENPLEVDAKGALWREAQARGKTSDVIEQAQQGGYDGVIIRNVRDRYHDNERSAPTDTFVVFSSEQIKAVDNGGGFDPTNPDIRFSVAPSDPQQLNQTKAAENKGKFLKGILHQPIDRMFRLPFDALGMIDSHGRLKGGVKLTEATKKAIASWRPHPEGRFGWMDNMLEVARAGLLDRYGLSDEYKTRWREAEAEERIRLTEGLDILRKLQESKVGLKEARVLQAILTGEQIAEGDWKDLAEPIRRALDDLGQELVSLGLLSAEAYQRNRGTYLHRSYLKHEASFTPVSKWVNDLMTKRRRKIVGNELKGRGIDARVHMSALRDAAPDQWWGAKMKQGQADLALKDAQFILFEKLAPAGEGVGTLEGMEAGGPKKRRVVERRYWPADLPVPAKFGSWENRGTWQVRSVKGSSVVLWRDYTKAERERMGEIVDARYNIAKTFEQLSHDIAIGRFFSDIAKNPEWFSAEEPEGEVIDAATAGRMSLFTGVDWVKVPTGKIPGTQTSKWGALAGGFVRAEIWRDLNELDRMQSTGLWRQLLTQWKQNKTARSPVVHMNNVMSNMMFMDLADVRVTDLVRGIDAYLNQTAEYQDAIRHGAFEGSFVTQEIRNRILQPILDEIMEEHTGGSVGIVETSSVLGKITNGLMRGIKKFDDKMLDVYQMEDELFRMATYMRRLELGDSPAEAASIAREQFLDYDIRAPWVNAARRTVLPFISYTYRAVPVITQSVVQRPWKLAKYFTMAQIWLAMAYSLAPGDEEEEQRTLQDEKRGYTWIGVPRMMRMPWRDENGNPVFMDIRRWIPAGDVFDTNQGTMGDLGIPAPLQFGGPMMMAFELALNKAAFTGDPIYDELTDTPSDMAGKIGDWAYKTWMPSAAYLPGSWYWDKAWTAAEGGRDYAGQPYSVPQALVSSVGIKIQPHDVEMAKFYASLEFNAKRRELLGKLRQLARDHERNLIDDEYFEKRQAKLVEQMKGIAQDAQYIMTGEEPE